MVKRIIAHALFVCVVSGSSLDAAVVVDGFLSTVRNPWSYYHSTNNADGMVWNSDSQYPGLQYSNKLGMASAWVSADVGTTAFFLEFEAQIYSGLAENWPRREGICVAITSAPPEQMGLGDLAIIWGMHREGISAMIAQGGLFNPNLDTLGGGYRPPYSMFLDRQLTGRGVINEGGRGGRMFSYYWPESKMIGRRLRLTITRNSADSISFDATDITTGLHWWSGGVSLPQSVTSAKLVNDKDTVSYPAITPRTIPLRYLCVKTVRESFDMQEPMAPLSNNLTVAGRITRLQLWNLTEGMPPVVQTIDAADAIASGTTFIIRGSGFAAGATVRVGQTPAQVTSVTPTAITVVAPTLPPGSYLLTITNLSGLCVVYPGGLSYGRKLLSLEPMEAGLGGSDTITVIGAGFTTATTFTVNGQAATRLAVASTEARILAPQTTTPGFQYVKALYGTVPGADSLLLGRGSHPCIFFKAADLPALRTKFNKTTFADYKKLFLYWPTSSRGSTPSRLWAYLLTGDTKYRDTLFEVDIPAALSLMDLSEFNMHSLFDIACVYDMLFSELSIRQRIDMQKFLVRGIAYYLNGVASNDWWLADNPSNTIAIGAACAGTAGMALYNGSDVARTAVQKSVETLKKKYAAMLSDGGCVEGPLYWDYGFTHQLILGYGLKTMLGSDQGLLENSRVLSDIDFVNVMCGGDGRMMPFNDAQPTRAGVPIMAYLGTRLNSPYLRWLADRYMHDQFLNVNGTPYFEDCRSVFSFFAFLWRDDVAAPSQFPGFPTLAKLDSLDWGTLRSDKEYFPRLMVGIKGRDGAITHHTQPDLGSFDLYARGQNFIIDPGYNQSADSCHSIPLVNKKGPGSTKKANITDAWENSRLRHMVVDVSQAYPDTLTRGKLIFTLCKDSCAIVLDDFVLKNPIDSDTITTQLQCGFATTVGSDSRSALITGDSANVAITVFGPPLALSVVGPKPFGNSWVYKGEGVQWYALKGGYHPVESQPLVTVLTPTAKSAVAMQAAVTYGADQIAVTLAGKAVVTFKKGTDGWYLPKPSDATGVAMPANALNSDIATFSIRNVHGRLSAYNPLTKPLSIAIFDISGRLLLSQRIEPQKSCGLTLPSATRGCVVVKAVGSSGVVIEKQFVIR